MAGGLGGKRREASTFLSSAGLLIVGGIALVVFLDIFIIEP